MFGFRISSPLNLHLIYRAHHFAKSSQFKSLILRSSKSKHFSTNSIINNLGEADGPKYIVTEINIPVPGGIIAGKLWEPTLANPDKQTNPLPPTICTHGWLDNAGSFDTLLPLLLKGHQGSKFFAFDLPGHGLTTYCPQWFYDGHVDGVLSIQRVLRHFGWDKVNLIGHSMGSVISFLFTALFPEQVHKYIGMELMRPLPRSLPAMMRASMNLVFEVEERNNVPRKGYTSDEILYRFYEGRQETISLEGCRILLQRGALPLIDSDKAPDVLYNYTYNFRTLIPGQEGRFTEELTTQFANLVKSPTCFIKADPGNIYESPEELEKFFGHLRQNLGTSFESHVVSGQHHFHLDNPKPVAQIIQKFLDL